MGQIRPIPFVKYHGLGNDFILVRGKGLPRSLPAMARAITKRQTGVGADGLIITLPPADPANSARIRIFNADGSEPEMSGNGIRCAGAFLLEEKPSQRELLIETMAGTKRLELIRKSPALQIFRVGMGGPILKPADIPFLAGKSAGPIIQYPLKVTGTTVHVTVTSMGNPHCSIFVPNFERTDWAGLGAAIERNSRFPNRTNVEFIKVLSRREIEVRFWERGVGKTMSSGTGSCGAVVACILNGRTGRKVRVRTLAGHLDVEWPENGEVMLTGPVVRVASGTFDYLS